MSKYQLLLSAYLRQSLVVVCICLVFKKAFGELKLGTRGGQLSSVIAQNQGDANCFAPPIVEQNYVIYLELSGNRITPGTNDY